LFSLIALKFPADAFEKGFAPQRHFCHKPAPGRLHRVQFIFLMHLTPVLLTIKQFSLEYTAAATIQASSA